MPQPTPYIPPGDALAVLAEAGASPSRQTVWRWLTSTPGLGVKIGNRWLANRTAFEAIAKGVPLADAARLAVGGDSATRRAA